MRVTGQSVVAGGEAEAENGRGEEDAQHDLVDGVHVSI